MGKRKSAWHSNLEEREHESTRKFGDEGVKTTKEHVTLNLLDCEHESYQKHAKSVDGSRSASRLGTP